MTLTAADIDPTLLAEARRLMRAASDVEAIERALEEAIADVERRRAKDERPDRDQ